MQMHLNNVNCSRLKHYLSGSCSSETLVHLQWQNVYFNIATK